eukprot:COSAG05_NODE_6896_length_885_cov_1.293893_2_plen_157_part_00
MTAALSVTAGAGDVGCSASCSDSSSCCCSSAPTRCPIAGLGVDCCDPHLDALLVLTLFAPRGSAISRDSAASDSCTLCLSSGRRFGLKQTRYDSVQTQPLSPESVSTPGYYTGYKPQRPQPRMPLTRADLLSARLLPPYFPRCSLTPVLQACQRHL